MIERYTLEKATEAYDQMISGRARFRVVLDYVSFRDIRGLCRRITP